MPQKNLVMLIGQCMEGTAIHAKLEYEVNNQDTDYILSLRRLQNNTIDTFSSIEFSSSGGTLNQLYNAIKTVIAKRNKKHKDYNITMALGDKLVVISTTRILGLTSAVIYLPEGYNYLTERQVDKIFGRI